MLESEPLTVNVEEGEEVQGVRLVVASSAGAATFQVAGRVVGLPAPIGNAIIQALPAERPSGSMFFQTASAVRPDGSFSLPNLSRGRYAFILLNRDNPYDLLNSGKRVSLGTVEIDRNRDDLVLQQRPATGLSGVLRFETSTPPPERVEVQASLGGDDFWSPASPAVAPDYRFDITHLEPGAYTLRVRSSMLRTTTPEFFVKEVRQGELTRPPRNLAVSEGRVEQVELVISDELSRIFGRVKAAGDPAEGIRKGAQFQVGLSGPQGFRAVQADQNGRFHFDKIVPGDYRICAWSLPDSSPIYNEETWKKAGDAVRSFPVEAGSEVEIDLTAVP
jgi:hypothetical protein